LAFSGSNLGEGETFRAMGSFFANNNSLRSVDVDGCALSLECAQKFVLALESSKKSLTVISLTDNEIDSESSAMIIAALCTHPQLERLEWYDGNFGRNGCIALAPLLQLPTTELQTLWLDGSGIDDEDLDLLTRALLNNSKLSTLSLDEVQFVSSRGWKILSTLLGSPNTRLETLSIKDNRLDDEVAVTFASALVNNCTLKELHLGYNYNTITSEGWMAFEKLLCDTSSVNKTFLSNHTLQEVYARPPMIVHNSLLSNTNDDKKQVAINKILEYHPDINMLPFFKCDMKMLPFVIDWLERAHDLPRDFEAGIENRKLSASFQFVQDFSWLCDLKSPE